MDVRLYILGGLALLFVVLLGYLFAALGSYMRAVHRRNTAEVDAEMSDRGDRTIPGAGTDVFTEADAGESIFGAPLRTAAWQPEEPQLVEEPAAWQPDEPLPVEESALLEVQPLTQAESFESPIEPWEAEEPLPPPSPEVPTVPDVQVEEPVAAAVPAEQPVVAQVAPAQSDTVESILLTLAGPSESESATKETVASADTVSPEMGLTLEAPDEQPTGVERTEPVEVPDLIAAYGLGGVWSEPSPEPAGVPGPQLPEPPVTEVPDPAVVIPEVPAAPYSMPGIPMSISEPALAPVLPPAPEPMPEIPMPAPEPALVSAVPPVPAPEPAPAPMPAIQPEEALPAASKLPTGEVLSAASGMAGAWRADVTSDREYQMVAPVELTFTVGEARVGVKPGTRTYAEFQRLAAVLLDDLHATRNRPSQG